MDHPIPTNDRGTSTTSRSVSAAVRAGAFWLAVLLPFASLGVLVNGLESTVSHLLFISLLVTNAIALIIGHGYHQ